MLYEVGDIIKPIKSKCTFRIVAIRDDDGEVLMEIYEPNGDSLFSSPYALELTDYVVTVLERRVKEGFYDTYSEQFKEKLNKHNQLKGTIVSRIDAYYLLNVGFRTLENVFELIKGRTYKNVISLEDLK